MVRGKVHLKRIQNPVNRRVTLSKRKGGMLKKAKELSVLCDAEIGLIIFSPTGKVYEFAKPNMDRIIGKYQSYFGFTEGNLRLSNELETLRSEVENLRKGIIRLEKMCKHMIGEDLEFIDSKELHRLEKKLFLGVRKIHSRREKMLLEHIQSLKLKEKTLKVENANLVKKIGRNHHHIDINSDLETEASTPPDLHQNDLNLTLS